MMNTPDLLNCLKLQLNAARAAADMTLEAVGREMNVSSITVSRWHNNPGDLKGKQFCDLCLTYGTDPGTVWGRAMEAFRRA